MSSTLLMLTCVAAVVAVVGAPQRPRVTGAALLVTLALVTASCAGDDDDDETDGPSATEDAEPTSPEDPVAEAQSRVADADAAVADAEEQFGEAGQRFCEDVEGYIDAVDRYGKLFTDEAATVGDVRTLGDDLAEPREAAAAASDEVVASRDALASARQELVDAQAALQDAIATASSLPTSSTTPATVTTTTLVPAGDVERVEQAEDDLAQVAGDITDSTPLREAAAEFNAAAFALEVAWLRVFADAGCLSDEQEADAVAQVTAYTASVQTSLQRLGYLDGEVDGIYGPQTVDAVKRFQEDSGLTTTGFVDQATSQAIDAGLAELDDAAAAGELTSTVVVQTILTLTEFWTGPIDGQWTDELTAALMEFQTSLGVPPTGVVDAATLAAFEAEVAAVRVLVDTTTTVVPATPTVAPPTTAPPTAPPTSGA